MQDLEKEKLKQFVNDTQMSNAVYNYLIQTCLKPKDYKSIEMAGGYKLALDFIQESWVSLNRLKVDDESNREKRNVGV